MSRRPRAGVKLLTTRVATGREPEESAHPARPSATCLPDFFCFLFAFLFLLVAAAAAVGAGVEVGVLLLVAVVVVVDAGNAASSASSASSCSCSWAAGLLPLFTVPAASRSLSAWSSWSRSSTCASGSVRTSCWMTVSWAGLGLGLGMGLGVEVGSGLGL